MVSDNRQLCDDAALCRLAQAGDRAAEEALILRYTRLVRRCAHPLFLIGGDSEDLTQEGLLGLFSAIRDYRVALGAGFATFAETCIRNRLFSAITTANRLKHTPLNTSVSIEAQDVAHTLGDWEIVDPESMVIAGEDVQELDTLLKGLLSPIESKVLQRYCDGYSYREIAAQLSVSAKTVDNAIQRIKTKLAKRRPQNRLKQETV